MLPRSAVLTPVHNFQRADESVYLTSELGFKAVTPFSKPFGDSIQPSLGKNLK